MRSVSDGAFVADELDCTRSTQALVSVTSRKDKRHKKTPRAGREWNVNSPSSLSSLHPTEGR
jgi:hypothetical protein